MIAPSQINQLRAGVIGTGFIGPVHMEALRRLCVQITAVCDQPPRAQQAAAKLGIPKAFDDYRQMLACPDVDVVHITAPNRFHYEMAMACLKAGKHCVCEKPLAMTTAETRRIVQAAAKSNTVFAVNYNVRFYPAVLKLRQMVRRGELGEIIHVQGSYLQDWLFKETDYNWRLLPREGGTLRAVADIGTHWLDTASFVIGSAVESVMADLGTWHKKRQRPLGEIQTFATGGDHTKYQSYDVKTEDYGNILLRYVNGTRGNLTVSQVAAGRKNCIRLELYGSKKSAWWCSENPEELNFGNRDGANEVAIRSTGVFGADTAAFCDYPPGHVEGFPDTFKMLYRDVYSAILDRKSKPLHATAEDGHAEAAVCEAIIRSHKNRRWQKVATK